VHGHNEKSDFSQTFARLAIGTSLRRLSTDEIADVIGLFCQTEMPGIGETFARIIES
jgi:hypothetical protein